MKLNITKINKELKRRGWKNLDLARAAGVKSRQLIEYYLRTGTIKGAEPIAKAFGIDPKDLIK